MRRPRLFRFSRRFPQINVGGDSARIPFLEHRTRESRVALLPKGRLRQTALTRKPRFLEMESTLVSLKLKREKRVRMMRRKWRKHQRENCWWLGGYLVSYPISFGDLCLMTCNFCLILIRCLAPIIRQFVKFRDMPKNKRKYWCTIVRFRDTPEIKWKHRCTISEVP